MSGARTVSIDTIKRMSARSFDVTVLDIESARRDPTTIKARFVAMYLARHLTAYSWREIGKHFGNRDRSSVHNAVRRIDHLLDVDGDLLVMVSGLLNAMLPGRPEIAA